MRIINQVKNMVAAMSVHGQRVQFFYSSLDTTNIFRSYNLGHHNLGHTYGPDQAQVEIVGWES